MTTSLPHITTFLTRIRDESLKKTFDVSAMNTALDELFSFCKTTGQDPNTLRVVRKGTRFPLIHLLMMHTPSEHHEMFLTQLISEGVDVNIQDEANAPSPKSTIFFWAVLEGKMDLVRLLLQQPGLDVNAIGHNGVTPLITSLQFNQIELVNLLLQHGADPTLSPPTGFSALHHCAYRGQLALFQLLEPYFDTVQLLDHSSRSPLYLAVNGGHDALIKHLTEQGALIHYNMEDQPRSFSPFLAACEHGKLELVHYFSQKDPSLLKRNLLHEAFHLSAKEGHISLVDFFIEKGVSIDHCYRDGDTILFDAILRNHSHLVRHLIGRGADVNQMALYTNLSYEGSYPLHLAAEMNDCEIARILVEEGGANLFAKNAKGHTALEEAELDHEDEPDAKVLQYLRPLYQAVKEQQELGHILLKPLKDASSVSEETHTDTPMPAIKKRL